MLEDTLAMLATRKQNAKEKRSRQSDVMFDLENMNYMLGNYPENRPDEELNKNIETQGLMGLGPACQKLRKFQNTIEY